MRVMHVLYTSLPDCSGSSIRSRGVVTSQKKAGLDPIVITSPFQKPISAGKSREFIGDIEYIRSYNGDASQEVRDEYSSFGKRLKKMFQILIFRKAVHEEAKMHHIDVIHGHSTFFCGLAALYAANKLAIPFIYEVRSLWEDRIADRDRNIVSYLSAYMIRILETYVIKKADHVVVISEALKLNLLNRGLAENNISIVGNAVEEETLFKGSMFNWPINGQNEFVFAYVGSVTNIEGLDLLLYAWKEFCTPNMCCKLKIIGGGVIKKELDCLVRKKNIRNVELCGPFAPSDAEKIYSVIDVIVNPRYRSKLSDVVTPLKPLEAMAYNKLVLTSDVGGMRNLVVAGQTGFLFKSNDVSDLVYWLKYIVNQDIEYLVGIVQKARNYVVSEKNWEKNAKTYQKLYSSLI